MAFYLGSIAMHRHFDSNLLTVGLTLAAFPKKKSKTSTLGKILDDKLTTSYSFITDEGRHISCLLIFTPPPSLPHPTVTVYSLLRLQVRKSFSCNSLLRNYCHVKLLNCDLPFLFLVTLGIFPSHGPRVHFPKTLTNRGRKTEICSSIQSTLTNFNIVTDS